MVDRWRGLVARVVGPGGEPGGPGAGVQLWWPDERSRRVVAARAVLEVLEAPADAAGGAVGCRWGLQASVVDGDQREAVTVDARWVAGSPVPVELSCRESSQLVDIAMWMELASPPSGPPVVARWSSPRWMFADGTSSAVPQVMVTFPLGHEWRRWDVQVDDTGVLLVTNTRRRTANQAVLRPPAAG